MNTAFILLVIAALLVIVGLCQPVAARLRLPPPVLLGAVGVVLGILPSVMARLGWSGPLDAFADLFVDLPFTSQTYIYVFLPLLVFQAGLETDVRAMIRDAAPILLLAVIATVVTTAAIGLALWPVSGRALVVCLMLGAVVATTDPAAVIAIFRDVGAPSRLLRLVEGEALLNDAAAIVMFTVLLGMIIAGREPDVMGGVVDFFVSFLGGGVFGVVAARIVLVAVPWMRDDRLAEVTLSVALAYAVFLAAEGSLHVSGVVAVLAAGLTLNALGRSRITPYNWSFLSDLWDQLAFWARSLIFVLASILVPKLLGDLGLQDLLLLGVLIAAAFGARLLVLFVLLPPLEQFKLTQPIDGAYKIVMTWGGLRGALTLVLALAATEHAALGAANQRFVATLATGFVLFTLFVNGTTLRAMISLLGLNRLSPRNQVLRDRVLALAYSEVTDMVRTLAGDHGVGEAAVEQVIKPYRKWIAAADARDAAERLSERDRLAVALVALANQERVLALNARADRIASPGTVQVLLHNADTLVEGARGDGRFGYRRAARATLRLQPSFHLAYWVYRHFGTPYFLVARLADRVELLLLSRLLVDRLLLFNEQHFSAIAGKRIARLTKEILDRRHERVRDALDVVRRQYPDYVAALEERFLRQSALRQEISRYQALYDEGLIPRELLDDLLRSAASQHIRELRPRFDLGLNTRRLVERLDLLAGLDEQHLDRVARLLRPRFTVPEEMIIRTGESSSDCFFIASGAVEVRRPGQRIRLGSGEFFGELALLTGQPRQADVVALTYCRLLVLRKADFEKFMADNPEAREAIKRVADSRLEMNRERQTQLPAGLSSRA
ncbi:MAG: cation:proton antiporter [Alphaproteobacteria bacterium]|nr:cation:proton antiporter [Alphaproteobacteria bacterium]